MNNKMKELLQEQTTADQTDNSDLKNGVTPNWQRIRLPNTPFWIIGNQEQGYNIIMGKWKLTNEPLNLIIPTNDEKNLQNIAYEWLQQNQFNLILSMIICITTDIEKQKQN